jgi:hypothetical protein
MQAPQMTWGYERSILLDVEQKSSRLVDGGGAGRLLQNLE